MKAAIAWALLLAACKSGGPAHRAPPDAMPGPCDVPGSCHVEQDPVPAPRGDIVDREHLALAGTMPAFEVRVVPATFDATARGALIRQLGLDDAAVALLDAAVIAGRAQSIRQPCTVLRDLTRDQATTLEAAHLPGVEVAVAARRHYPMGTLAAHVVGYATRVTRDELDRLAGYGYQGDELVGRYGLEAQWNEYLRGKAGAERRVVDAHGREVDAAAAARVLDGPARLEPVPGRTVVTTLDGKLQQICEAAVAGAGGAAVVVVEVATGRVLAMVSTPTFDPERMSAGPSNDELAALEHDPGEPFRDRAAGVAYPPGALYQIVTRTAAIENGLERERGDAARVAPMLGIDAIAAVARRLGFGAPTGLGLLGEVPGRVPDKAWYQQRGATFTPALTVAAAQGTGDTQATVLQVAMAYAAVAGGASWTPQVVGRVEQPDGTVIATFEPRAAAWTAPAPEVLDLLRADLRAGVGDGEWFAGWAPADDPRIAIAVRVDGGSGAAVARTILDGWR